MTYYDEDTEEREEEPHELPTITLGEPGPCSTCGKADQHYGCFRCGRPVCYNAQNYLADSTCGGWILDSWHPDAPEGNEFYCNMCLHAGLLVDKDITVAGITFAYTDHQTVQITFNDQLRELSVEETRNLVAYLYDQRGELFIEKSMNQEHKPEPVSAVDDLDDFAF